MRVSPSSRNRPPDAATCFATMNRAPAVPMNVNFTYPLPFPTRWGRWPRRRAAGPVGDGEVGGEAAGWGVSRFCDLRQWNFGFLAEVAVVQLGDAVQRVDLIHWLVVADAHDARKAKSEAAVVPVRPLDRIER